MLTQSERDQLIVETLTEVSKAIREIEAPGPAGYWFKKLEEQLTRQAQKRIDNVAGNTGNS